MKAGLSRPQRERDANRRPSKYTAIFSETEIVHGRMLM